MLIIDSPNNMCHTSSNMLSLYSLFKLHTNMVTINYLLVIKYSRYQTLSIIHPRSTALIIAPCISHHITLYRPYSEKQQLTQKDKEELTVKKLRPITKSFIFNPLAWISLSLILIVATALAYHAKSLQDEYNKKRLEQTTKSIGKASIGGPFSLVDHEGNSKTDEDYRGHWVMIYFGFTFCPDICPEELEKIGDVIDTLDDIDNIPKLIPLFISIDPDRDTPDKVNEYLKDFHPKIVGLTGTSEQVDSVAKNYRVYYSKSKPDLDNDYLVDHTIVMYLINPAGEFVDYFGKNKTVEEISSSIANYMLTY